MVTSVAEHRNVKMWCEEEAKLHAVLISALDGDEWSSSGFIRFILRDGAFRTHFIRKLDDLRSYIDVYPCFPVFF
jgi:hypothetical protein